jgi:thioredoxin-like negative regulator of GroEL
VVFCEAINKKKKPPLKTPHMEEPMTDRKRAIDELPLDKMIEFWKRIEDDPTPERMRAEAVRDPQLAAECALQAENMMQAIDYQASHDTLIKMLDDDPTLAHFILTFIKYARIPREAIK